MQIKNIYFIVRLIYLFIAKTFAYGIIFFQKQSVTGKKHNVVA